MDIVDLLERAKAAGVSVNIQDGQLRVKGPESEENLVQEITDHKEDIVRYLNGEPAEPNDEELHDAPWPAIESFDELNLPPFPTDALPDGVREWVVAESHATQTPPDLAGLLALAVCSATIARRVVVEPRPGWPEPVNLYVAVLLEPGNRKSAVFGDATKPLKEIESQLVEAAQPTVVREQSARRQSEARLKYLEKRAVTAKGDAKARHEAGELAVELRRKREPVMPRLIVDDATAEKLGIILDEQRGRIASMSPEGGVFDLMAGLYSKNGIPQIDVYLKAHSGDDLITDRVSRKSVWVRRPALTCAYAIQPQVIEGIAGTPAFRGRGLLARFLYAAPQSWIGERVIAPTPVPDAVRESYRLVVRTLASNSENIENGFGELKNKPTTNFENIENGPGELKIKLTGDAEVCFRSWESEIEKMLSDGGEMETIRDWGAKLAGETLRIAAVLHCVQHGPRKPINETTIAAAIEIGRYLIPHAQAVLTMMQLHGGSSDDDAHYVLRWIERHGLQEFTKRDAQQHGKSRFHRADDIDPALEELSRRGYIRLRLSERTGPGRPTSPTFEVNPALFKKTQEPKNRSQYSQNSDTRSENGNSENIENAFEQSENDDRVQVEI